MKLNSTWLTGIAIAGVLLLAGKPGWATDYSGTCTGTVPAGSHQLVGTCTVPSGQSWTLEPGAVLAGNGFGINVSGTLNMDQADVTQGFISFSPGSGGIITATVFDNTSSSSACLITITDASPTFSGGNAFEAGTGVTRWLCVGGSSLADPAAPLISGNTFGVNYSGGGIDVGGTAQPDIGNNVITVVGGAGVSFEDTSAGTLTANTIGFEADAASGRTAISVSEDASPLITGNTITDDSTRDDVILNLPFDSTSTAQVTGNTVNCSGGDIPLRLGAGVFANVFGGDVSGNVYSCAVDGVAQFAGTFDADATLAAVDGAASLDLWTTVTVPDGITVDIVPGFSLDGLGNAFLVDGTLNADQAAITQVFLDYRAGSAGSITASTFDNTSSTSSCLIDIVDASPSFTAGNDFLAGVGTTRWICIGGVSLASPAMPLISGNTFDVSYSGGGIDVGGTAQPTIDGNTIVIGSGVGASFEDTSAGSMTNNSLVFQFDTASSRTAILLTEDASPAVTGNTIVDDTSRDDTGLSLQFSSTSAAQVTGNTVGCSGGDVPLLFAMGVFGNGFAGDVSGNIYSCTVDGVAQIAGTVDTDATLTPIDGVSSYDLWTTLNVPAGTSLTIPAGLGVDGRGNALLVDGTLDVDQAQVTQVFLDYRAGSAGSITASTFDNTSSTSSCLIDIVDASPVISGNNSFLEGTGTTRWICIGGTSQAEPAAPLIDGNSFLVNYSGGGIDVGGTAEPVISNNTIGIIGGIGVSFEDTAAGTLSANDIDFETDTASGRSAIYVFDDASPAVTANDVGDDPTRSDIALNLQFSSFSSAIVTGNTVACSGGDVPLQTGMGVFGAVFTGSVAGNVYGCDIDGAAQIGGTVDSDATLATLDGASNFELWTTLSVPAGLALTIPAGIGLDGTGFSLPVSGTLDVDQASVTQTFIDYNAGSSGSITDSTFDNTSSSSACLVDIADASPSITGNVFLPGTGTSRWICITGSAQPPQAFPAISGNTLSTSYVNGGIDIGGTSQPDLTGNTINVVSGTGLSFEDSSAGSATGNILVFEPGGSANRTGLWVFDDASPNASGNTIVDDDDRSDTGLLLTMSADSTAVVSANDVGCSGDDTPLNLGPGPLGDSFGGTVTGNVFSCLQSSVLFSGTVVDDTTLGLFDGLSSYRLGTTLTVDTAATLTVPAGVSIFGQNNTMTVNGTADIGGLLDNIFLRVTSGGTLFADGMTKISTNDWIDLDSGSTATIVNSTITGTSGTGVFIADADATIADSTLRGWATAVRLEGLTGAGNIVFDGNLFENNNIGIDIDSAVTTSTATDNVFVDNTYSLDFDEDVAVYSAYPTDFGTSSFTGGPALNLLRLPGTFNDSGIIPVAPAPYYTSSLTISGGAQVTAFGGTVFAAGNATQIVVDAGSRLVASGSEFFPVVFTDFNREDNASWRGLVIRGDDSVLQNCVVEFSQFDGLTLDGAAIEVTGCRISDNQNDGVELTGDASPTISGGSLTGNLGDGVKVNLAGLPLPGPITVTGQSIFSNGGLGINNLSASFNVEAMLNYWGDDSGPFDGSDDTGAGGLFNPTGQGQAVSDNVLYDPWIILGPSQEGVIVPVSGGGQTGVIGETLPLPLVVRIDSLLGTPLEDIEVIFSVVSGDASIVEPQPLLTAANGEAQATVQLGLTPGEVQFAVTARDVNSPLATFIGEADNPCLVTLHVLPADLAAGGGRSLGDVNGDGLVNVQDAALVDAVLRGSLPEKSPLVPAWGRLSDANGDRQVDSGDVLVIQGVQIGQVPTQTEAAQ